MAVSEFCNYRKILLLCFIVILCGLAYYVYGGTQVNQVEVRLDDKIRDSNQLDKSVKQTFKMKKSRKSRLNRKQSSKARSQGYILPYHLYEQQTAAARNLWGLQLLAKTVDMKVVEPFISNTTMSFLPLVDGISDLISFNDMFDREYWNKQATLRGCAELVSWKEFLSKASKRIIFVQICGEKLKCPRAMSTMYQINDNIQNPLLPVSLTHFSQRRQNCFRKLGFKFIYQVLIRFNASLPLTAQEFTHIILGEYHPSDVTIIFANWLGVRSSRVNLKDIAHVSSGDSIGIGLLPSKKMVEDSERYLQQLRPGGGKYFGVMVRVERAYKDCVKQLTYNTSDVLHYLKSCARNLTKLEVFQTHNDWGRTLAIDLGNFGSLRYRRRGQTEKTEAVLYNEFFNSIFGNSWTIEEFESSFTRYLGTTNPAYIAQVQRTIAARSDCIVLVGGDSTYQTAAISFYKNFHPNVEQQCIIKHCFKGKNLNIKQFVNNQ